MIVLPPYYWVLISEAKLLSRAIILAGILLLGIWGPALAQTAEGTSPDTALPLTSAAPVSGDLAGNPGGAYRF